MGIPCVLLHRELCRKTVFRPEQEIRIRAFQTRHLDKLYWDVPHFCYLLECGEKKLLLRRMWISHRRIFCGTRHGAGCGVCQSADEPQRGGQGIICGRRIADKDEDCLSYSFAGEDKMMIRKIVEQEMRAGRQENALFFMEEGQTCLI